MYQTRDCNEETSSKDTATYNLVVILPLLVTNFNFVNALNLFSAVRIVFFRGALYMRDMENKALGLCKSNGNVLNSAFHVISVSV